MNQDPRDLLRMAKAHVDKLSLSSADLKDLRNAECIDHALQAIILSAAAVESAANFAISMPITRIKPVGLRRFYSQFLRLAMRGSIRDKLTLIVETADNIDWTKDFKRELRALFDARNGIVHSSPEYKEYPAVSPHTDGLSEEAIASLEGVMSVLQVGGRSTTSLETANVCWRTAAKAVQDILKARFSNAKRDKL